MDNQLKNYIKKILWVDRHDPNTLVHYLYLAIMQTDPSLLCRYDETLALYLVGSTKDEGAVLWYIAHDGTIADGRCLIIHPDGETDERPSIRERLGTPTTELPLFGEHILSIDPRKPVGIVADELTAIYMTVAVPSMVWLAAPRGVTTTADQSLRKRRVYLFLTEDVAPTWRRFLRNSEVVDMSNQHPMIMRNDERLRTNFRRLSDSIERLESEHRHTLIMASHHTMMHDIEPYRMMVDRLQLIPVV